MLLVALLFAALGAAIGSLLDDMQGFQLIMNFLVMPLFFLSGALFPLNGLPAVLKGIVKFDPLSYGIDSFRILLVNPAPSGSASTCRPCDRHRNISRPRQLLFLEDTGITASLRGGVYYWHEDPME